MTAYLLVNIIFGCIAATLHVFMIFLGGKNKARSIGGLVTGVPMVAWAIYLFTSRL